MSGKGKKKAGAGPPKQQPAQTKTRKKKVKTQMEPISRVTKQGNRVPKTVTTAKGTMVSHTETYGVNVTGSDPFSVFATWALQPGLAEYNKGSPLGQWLPQIAQNFDNYEIESLRFKFRTACSTLTTGLAVFGFEPNPEGTAPTTYQEIRNMYSVDGSVHANLVFDVSSRVRRKMLIRKGTVINLPSYDVGKVYFSTIGVTGSALIGFVDVEYRVRLYNPQASTTTSVVPVVNNLPTPQQRWTADMSSMGELNCASESDHFCNQFLSLATNAGAALFRSSTEAYAAVTDNYTGCSYKWPARTGYRTFSCEIPGRYKVVLMPKIGWEDLKMFCFTLYSMRGGTGSAMLLATRKVFSNITGTTVTELTAEHYTHRGFTGTAVGDPNPGTEVWPAIEWHVDCTLGENLLIPCGYLTYNSVSTTDAKIKGYSGIGATTVLFEYLGPYYN
nr:structural protein [Sobelivirales sp.]